jgi:predicted dehydrogenase
MKLRIGVVGAGRITQESHLPVLKTLKKVEVAAICDQRISVAKEVASRFRVKSVFDDLAEMLLKEKLDVVDICTPPHTHASLSIQAMEAGCHVLVEKPMATSVHEADRMISSSKKHNVKLCVVHQNICNPVVMKAKRLVETGAVGDLLNVDVRTFERKDSEMCLNENHWCHTLPGGIFYEILPHPVYLLQSFLKDIKPVNVVSRKLGNVKWMKNDELRVLVEAENGLGSIVVSCNSPIHGDTFEILGSKKALRADLWGRTLITFKSRTQSSFSVGISNMHLGLQLFKVIGSTASTLLKTVRGNVSAHYAFISRFIDSISNNIEPPTTAENGRETVKILEEICKQLK